MPVYSFNLDDFNELVGKKYTINELAERLPMLGTAWEGIEEDGQRVKIEVFPNRPDLLSIEGLARAFSGFEGIHTGLIHYKTKKSNIEVYVDPSVQNVRPYMVVGKISGVKMTEDILDSLIQVQESLHVTHGRARRKVSIGAHDPKHLKFPLYYKAVGLDDIKFVPLQIGGEDIPEGELTPREILKLHPVGKKYAHLVKDKAPMFVDSEGQVLAFPPILNGELTRVSLDTKELLIDVTGMDFESINIALNILTTAMADRGFEVEQVKVIYPEKAKNNLGTIVTPDLTPKTYKTSKKYIVKRLGIPLSDNELVTLLEKMRFGASIDPKDKDTLIVQVPPYRADIFHPIDLLEDVAIAYGYNNIKFEIPQISTIGNENPKEIFSRHLAYLMVGYGAIETLTYILTNPETHFEKMNLPPNESEIVIIANPVSQLFTICRSWLLPSLIEALSNNVKNEYPQQLFEINTVVKLDKTVDTGARNEQKLAYVYADDQANFTAGKQTLEGIALHLGLKFTYAEAEHPSFIPGRTAKVFVEPTDKNSKKVEIGILGEIHPSVLLNWNIMVPVVAFELSVDTLYEITSQK